MKLGLGESYDKVSILPVKTRAYIDLAKPASIIGAIGVYALGSLFFFYYTNQEQLISSNIRDIIFVVATMGFTHAAAQIMNMAEDAEIDKKTPHKQNRPIPSGIVSEEEARTLAWFLILFALGRAYLVTPEFGGFTTIIIIFGIFYNLDPIRAKERIISVPWQAVSRGLFTFPAIWAAYGDPYKPTPWILGIFLFFYVLGFQNTADIIDKKIDEEFGIKTFIVIYGVKGVAVIALGCIFFMIATIMVAIEFNLLPQRFIFMLLIIPFCIIMLYHMVFNSHKVSERTGNHPSWVWFYVGGILSVLIPLLIEINKPL